MPEAAKSPIAGPGRPKSTRTPRGRRVKTHMFSHSELCEKIGVVALLKRLADNAHADEERMTASQVRSAEILLKKVIPDLKSVEVKGEGGGPVQHTVTVTFTTGGKT